MNLLRERSDDVPMFDKLELADYEKTNICGERGAIQGRLERGVWALRSYSDN